MKSSERLTTSSGAGDPGARWSLLTESSPEQTANAPRETVDAGSAPPASAGGSGRMKGSPKSSSPSRISAGV